ncbi:radical SAM protein [Candidatus Saganbacteria bacterium]|nr:radical SAM protein [Candidatus Saganbacteria bacterium]
MNKNDSERLAGVFEFAGYAPTDAIKTADLVLVNTCAVRENAENVAMSYLMSLKGDKKKNPNLKVVASGCVVAIPEGNLKKQLSHVDLFITPSEYQKLADFLGVSPCTFSPKRSGSITAWITIMNGCDNFCSYCIVPYVRGRERSIPAEDILSEIKQLGPQYREIFLLGQNVNSYKYGFADLMKRIEAIIEPAAERRGYVGEEPRAVPAGRQGLLAGSVKIDRIRFMTSHPKDMSDEIIDAVHDLPHVCEYFHLPIQHGDDEILKSMNRGYTVSDYKKIVDKIRNKIPNAAITSDIIVGYPDENDSQFQNSLNIIKDIGFDAVNTAVYSPRAGAKSSKLTDNVPADIKVQRLGEIMEVVDAVALERNSKLIGSVQEILVEPPSLSPPYQGGDVPSSVEGQRGYKGRTRTNKIVKLFSDHSDLIGNLVNVKIKSAKSWILQGELTNG